MILFLFILLNTSWVVVARSHRSYATKFSTFEMAAEDSNGLATVNVAALFRCKLYMFLQ